MANALMHGEIPQGLDAQTRAMVEYARKLTLAPSSMEEVDLDGLRVAGLAEEQVLDVVLISCLFNFMTRLADGLGVEVEPGKEKAVHGWLQVRPGPEWDWLRHNPGKRPGDR
ncbi:MAG: hypothetical protein M3Q29_17155 [Chloroflexota bacterium]|nr:hypothetical protein [Chloroflexota bacterium]